MRLSFGPAIDDAFIEAACARIAECGAALATPRLTTAMHDALGAMRLATGGWLLFDAPSRTCALVDAPEAPLALIAAEGYTLHAVLDADSIDAITLGTHRVARDADGRFSCGGMTFDGPAAAALPPAPVLEHAQLADFWAEHPDARLIDVRETFEHAAGAASLAGRTPESAPLSRHAETIPAWLAEQGHPLVFVCRSGGRSARAAATLRHLGRDRVYHLAGGFALAGEPQT